MKVGATTFQNKVTLNTLLLQGRGGLAYLKMKKKKEKMNKLWKISCEKNSKSPLKAWASSLTAHETYANKCFDTQGLCMSACWSFNLNVLTTFNNIS